MTSRRKLGCCFTCMLAMPFLCGCKQKQTATAPAVQELTAVGQLGELLKPGVFEVKECDVAPSPRMVELSDKLTRAMREDLAWFSDYVQKAEPGEPLAYHPKLGLSEAEYQEYLQFVNAMTLQEIGTAVMHVSEVKHGVQVRIDSAQESPLELTLEFATGQLHTPVGTVGSPIALGPDAEVRGLGSVTGFKWHEEKDDAPVFALQIGRTRSSGQGFLYCRLQRQKNESVENVRPLFLLPNRPTQ